MMEAKPLLSRVADAVYWMGRYIERAENVARFVGVNLHLQLDLPLDSRSQWASLINASGDAAVFEERAGTPTQSSVVEFLTFEASHPNSIYSCVRSARENARSVRETISSEMWEQINSLFLMVQDQRGRLDVSHLSDFFRSIRMGAHLFQGISDTTMTHNEAWHFLRLGRELERADKTSRMLDVKYFMLLPSVKDVGTPYDDIHWSAVLKSASAFEMYRKKHGHLTPRNIVEFLLMDRDFPRAIRCCVTCADESLHLVTGTPAGSFRYRSEQLMGMLRADLDFASMDTILHLGLHEYLDNLQTDLNEVDDAVHSDFFAVRPVASMAPA